MRSPRRSVAVRTGWLLASASLAIACKDPPPEPGSTNTRGVELRPDSNQRCVIHLHGKGGRGGPPEVRAKTTHLHPNGNATGWDGLQWQYFPKAKYDEVHSILASTLDAAKCQRAIVHGFSNGAAAAAKLACKNERFDGRVIGYIVDDPVPDHGVDGCVESPKLKLRLYWSGALGQAVPGWKCAAADWTCEGGETLGIQAYARALGLAATPSVHQHHAKYDSPPEYTAWW